MKQQSPSIGDLMFYKGIGIGVFVDLNDRPNEYCGPLRVIWFNGSETHEDAEKLKFVNGFWKYSYEDD